MLCKRDKDVAVRTTRNFQRIESYELEIRKFSKVLKDAKASVHERRFAKQRIELADEHRNMIKESLSQW